MHSILQWLASPEWAQTVKTLLHTLWQGALAAVALGLVLRRAHSPAVRYRCAMAALGVVILSGVITWAVLNPPATQVVAFLPLNADSISAPTEVASSGEPATIVVATASKPAPSARHSPWTAWLALAWLAGAALMLARAAVQVAGAERLRRSSRPLDDPAIHTLLSEARRTIGLARKVRVAVTNKLTSPAVVGVLVPTLIIPLTLVTALTPEQIRFVLLHELAHIRRGDYLANLFQLFAEALLFFNPAVWWISYQARREREACCDALATELSGAPADYARTLVRVAEHSLNPPPAPAPAFGNERASSLAERVQRLLVPGYRPALRLTWRAILGSLLIATMLLALSAVGTRVTLAAAARLLTPEERIEQIEQKMIEHIGQLPQPDTHGDAPATRVQISGRVRMADGSALPDVRSVSICYQRPGVSGVEGVPVNADGVFSGSVSSGSIYAAVFQDGLAPAVLGPFDATMSNRIDNLDVVLGPGFEAPLLVVDEETGEPVAGARIYAMYQVGTFGIGKRRLVQTDASGRVALSQCSSGVGLSLTVSARGYEIADQDVKELAPERTTRIPLRRGFRLTGNVLDKNSGAPIADATVRLIHEKGTVDRHYRWQDETRVLATSDSSGRFTISQLGRGAYWLGVSAPGHESAIVPHVLSASDALTVKLGPELIVRGTISGDVRQLQDRRGRFGIWVTQPDEVAGNSAFSDGPDWIPVRVANGLASFEFTNRFVGQARLTAGGFHFQREVVEPVENWAINLEQTQSGAEAVRRREVVFRFSHPSGVPPHGTVSIMVPASANPSDSSVKLAEFAITNGEVHVQVPVGRQTSVAPKHTIGYWFEQKWVPVTEGADAMTIDVPLVPAGAVYASAKNADGTPAGGILFSVVEVTRSPLRDEISPLGGSDGFSTDAPRKWVSGPLPLQGAYQIVAWRGNAFAVSDVIALTEEKPVAEVELQFAPAVAIEGVVLDTAGKPVPGAKLTSSFQVAGKHGFGLKTLFTDREGRFRLADVTPAPGEFSTVVSSPGHRAERFVLDLTKLNTLRLQPGKKLFGRVFEAGTGRVIPDAEVMAAPMSQLPRQNVYTDSEGRFEFTTLGDASYMLYVAGAAPLNGRSTLFAAGHTESIRLEVVPFPVSKLMPKTPPAGGQSSSGNNAKEGNVADDSQLQMRSFSVDPDAFIAHFGLATETNSPGFIRDFFLKHGVDLNPALGKSVFLSASGGFLIRATPEDLRRIEALFQKADLPKAGPPAPTQKTLRKLQEIRLPQLTFEKTPLSEVLRTLTEQSKQFDPEGQGVQYLLDFSRTANSPTEQARSANETYLAKVTVSLSVRDADLNAILRAVSAGASEPISHLVLRDGTVAFNAGRQYAQSDGVPRVTVQREDNTASQTEGAFVFRTQPGLSELFIRKFKLDPNTFYLNLEEEAGLRWNPSAPDSATALQKGLIEHFKKHDVNLASNTNKRLFWNDREGTLLVRATSEDLDKIERVLQALNTGPAHVHTRTRFFELREPAATHLRAKWVPASSSTGVIHTVLSPDRASELLGDLSSADRMMDNKITTRDQQWGQIQHVDLHMFALPGTNGVITTNPVRLGAVIDLIATRLPTGSIEIITRPSVTELVGYDDPGPFIIQDGNSGVRRTAQIAVPQFRVRQASVTNAVPDGHTLVITGLPATEIVQTRDKTPVLGDIPVVGRLFRSEKNTTQTNNLFILVTPTLVDGVASRQNPER